MSQHTDTAVATKLLSLRIHSEGTFDSGRGLNINENISVDIAVGLSEETEGFYTINGPRGYADLISSIEIADDRICFCLRGPLGELRACKLLWKQVSSKESESHWSGELWGDYFDPETGNIMKMSAKCSAHLARKTGVIKTKEIHLIGIASYDDAVELALRTRVSVNAILQAYRIAHPDDKDLSERIRLGAENAGTLMKTALLGGKGPLVGEEATLQICERALKGLGSRTIYTITEEES